MGGSSFGVGDGDGKGGVGPRTTHLTPQKVDCCIDSGDFFSLQSREHSYRSNSYKERSYYSPNVIREDHYVADGDG